MTMPPPVPPGPQPQGPTAQPGFGPSSQPGPWAQHGQSSQPGPWPQAGPTAQPGWGGQAPPSWPGGNPGPGPAPGQAPPSASPDTLGRVAQILCPILVIAGLSIPQSGSVGWTDYTLWAVFAAVMAVAQLITLASRRDPAQANVLRMIATGALVAYWVVIVLPGISSNGGFLQTLGVGCAVVAAWLGGARR
ncbi:hypothetical protein [Pseudactinotalea suaedae]|uniref:hypothetical protein n=1 Tax=Pseudactinotalea suaedae TaxID=1524924 RepID=UPI0012E15B88|nr:hypothetical protein [Pseudactinotalea suaedae]